MSKAYELMKRFEALSDEDRRCCFQFFTGCIGAVSEGFNPAHKDQAHAKWAEAELEIAIEQREGKRTR